MLVTLSGYELEQAIQMYLEKQFNRKLEIEINDEEEVSASINLDSVLNDEPEEFKVKKPKRRKVEILDNNDETSSEIEVEEDVEVKTKYSTLPRLNQEDQIKYTNILSLLNTNPLNKNRVQLEELSKDVSEDLQTVLNASEHFQDWLKYCEEQDTEKAMKEILQDEPIEEEREEIKENVKEEVITDVVPKKVLFTQDSTVTRSGSLFPSQPTRRVF